MAGMKGEDGGAEQGGDLGAGEAGNQQPVARGGGDIDERAGGESWRSRLPFSGTSKMVTAMATRKTAEIDEGESM